MNIPIRQPKRLSCVSILFTCLFSSCSNSEPPPKLPIQRISVDSIQPEIYLADDTRYFLVFYECDTKDGHAKGMVSFSGPTFPAHSEIQKYMSEKSGFDKNRCTVTGFYVFENKRDFESFCGNDNIIK